MVSTGFRRFDHTVQETNGWLQEIADLMGNPDRQMAYHALRGVLFALRDRLPVDEVFNLAAQLPMLIRGIYFEGYKVTGKPEKFHAEEFLAHIHQELQKVGQAKPEKAASAVFTVLSRHITTGECDDIRAELPRDVRELWSDDDV